MNYRTNFAPGVAAVLVTLSAVPAVLAAQLAPAQESAGAQVTMADLQRHLDEMSAKIDSLHQQLVDSETEMEKMRAELSSLRSDIAEKDQHQNEAAADTLRASVNELREHSEVLESEVKQHDQTKVESASKYPVRITGTVLFTSILNSSPSDNIDLPVLATAPQAYAPKGSLSASMRQTILGLEGAGPHVWGASSSAALSVDFFGGTPYADYTSASGLLRLRTAHATLAWPSREVTVAFDRPTLSPREPTSWITLGEPPLAWSGNLWTWSPQLEYTENWFGNNLRGTLALIDPPSPGANASTGLRAPDAAESSRQPGYEAHGEGRFSSGPYAFELGAGGYYSHQRYSYGRHLDAWGATADWRLAIGSPIEISGQFYRGRALGGLGGGTFKDYVGLYDYRILSGLDDEGGWGQLKWRFSQVLEANLAAGEDNAFAGELRGPDAVPNEGVYQDLARNLTGYANLVFRPRTYLVLSTEYRQIRSWPVSGAANHNNLFGLAAGYVF